MENKYKVIDVDVINLKSKLAGSKVIPVGSVIASRKMKLFQLDSYFNRLTMFLAQRQNIANATRLPKAELFVLPQSSEYGLNENGFLEKGGKFYYDKDFNLQEYKKTAKSAK